MYEKFYRTGDSLLKSGEYEEAIFNYLSAISYKNNESGTPYFKAAECALNLKNEKLANFFIRNGISIGGASKEYLVNYKGFSKYKKRKFFVKILKDYNNLRQEFFTTIENIDLYIQIEKLLERDQHIRDLLDEYEINNQEKNDSLISEKTIYKLIGITDSINTQELKNICNEYGWQPKGFIILWHQRDSYGENNATWNYFKPLIDKEISKGKVSRGFWEPFEWFKQFNNRKSNIPSSKKE